MATPSPLLIEALRSAARKLENHADYQWGHMGACNCGHLAQHLLKLSKDEIHSAAMERMGDWSDQLNDYCPSSGLAIDDMIDGLLSFGITRSELAELEHLSNSAIVAKAGLGYLVHNKREHVIAYLKAWASILEEAWANLQPMASESMEEIAQY